MLGDQAGVERRGEATAATVAATVAASVFGVGEGQKGREE